MHLKVPKMPLNPLPRELASLCQGCKMLQKSKKVPNALRGGEEVLFKRLINKTRWSKKYVIYQQQGAYESLVQKRNSRTYCYNAQIQPDHLFLHAPIAECSPSPADMKEEDWENHHCHISLNHSILVSNFICGHASI